MSKTGRRISDIVEGVDVLPTLLDCAAIQRPAHLQGRSFFPALKDGAWSGRPAALTEMHGWKTLRSDQYRYVLDRDGREQLYYLPEDPRAYCNLSADPAHGAALAQMRHQLLVHQLESERPRERIWPY